MLSGCKRPHQQGRVESLEALALPQPRLEPALAIALRQSLSQLDQAGQARTIGADSDTKRLKLSLCDLKESNAAMAALQIAEIRLTLGVILLSLWWVCISFVHA